MQYNSIIDYLRSKVKLESRQKEEPIVRAIMKLFISKYMCCEIFMK